ncbi:hypothetical protein AMAG_02204 [Allomyces macrogynus ATCC 38327]|uniref:BHLH domain-containing protein n=1 Tax=Allomyces macrogynus (strain ATCC 38327) TaxID=578462 RepID=A0A0L0S1V8_ALLM3|nr:hypothetical protein AMAG_02204 [Allomyces macrogynus ATCC 38327]|eukprot:KNE56395.1 hypothetical protein AMAG_02204 [Allomyces macrogynus ATCC 38327]
MTGAHHSDPADALDHGPPRPSSAASAASAAALHQQQHFAAAAAAMANPFAAAAAMYSMTPAAAAMAAAAASNPLAMMAGGAMNPFMPRFGMVDDAMTTAAAMASWGHMPYNPVAAAAAVASGMSGMPGMGLGGLGPNPAAFLNAMAASTPAPPEPVQRPRGTRTTTDATPGFDNAVDAAGADTKRAPPLHCPVPVVATLAAPTPPMSSPIHARFPSTDPFSQWSSSAPVPPLHHHTPSRARSTAPPADTTPESAQEKERRKTKEAKRRQDIKSRVQRLCTMIGAPVSGAYNASTLDAVIVHMQQLHTTIDELYSMKRILEEQGVNCNAALARARRECNGSASPPKQQPSTTVHDYTAEDPCRSESKHPSSKSRQRPLQPPVTAIGAPHKENIPPTPARPHTPPAYPRVTTAEDMAALLAMDQTTHPPPYVATPTPTPTPASQPSTASATPATMTSAPGNSLKARSVLGVLTYHPTRPLPGSPVPPRPASRATARAAAAPYPTRPTPSRRASSVLSTPDAPTATTPSWTPSRLPRQPHETPAAPAPGRVPLSATKRISPQSQRAVHEASPSKAVTLEIADDGMPFFAGVTAAAAATAPMDDLDQMMESVLDPGLRMALLSDVPLPPPVMPPHANMPSLDDELSQILEMADAAAATPRVRLMPEMSPPASEADAAVRSSPPVLDEQRGEYEHPATDDDLDGEWGADAHRDDEAPGLLELTPFAAEHGHSDAPSGAEYRGDEAAQYQYDEEEDGHRQHQWTDEAMQFQEFLVDGHDA